jgi:integrase
MIRRRKLPKYRLHKPSGQAVVTLSGKEIYLGPFNSEISRVEYDRQVAEWLANGRELPPDPMEGPGLTVTEVMLRYWNFADGYYRQGEKPSPEWYHIRTALKVVRKLYGRTPAAKFGPLALKACREEFLNRGQNRRTINQNVGRVKRMFRWAVENELVPPGLYHGLQAVAGLKRGRCEAPESEGVKPVPEADVEAVLPQVSRQVAAMIRLQLLTGMRPGELVIMRAEDVNREGPIWIYEPTTHKNAHRGHERNIYIGPQGQQVLWPFLQGKAEGYLFSPRQAEEERNAKKRKSRGKAKRRKGRQAPKWQEHYDVASYRRAIRRACEKAGAEPWSPHRLRHSAATKLRQEFGIEAARVILGHRSAAVTEIYAEIDREKALKVMEKVG